MLVPPMLVVSSLLSYNSIGDILTLQNVDTLSTKVILVGSAVVYIPGVVDPLDLRCPHCRVLAHSVLKCVVIRLPYHYNNERQ